MIDECEEGLMRRLKRAQREDDDLKKIFDAVERDEIANYTLRGGVQYKNIDDDIRVIIPKVMRRQVIRKAHEQGHFGVTKTEALLKRDY